MRVLKFSEQRLLPPSPWGEGTAAEACETSELSFGEQLLPFSDLVGQRCCIAATTPVDIQMKFDSAQATLEPQPAYPMTL